MDEYTNEYVIGEIEKTIADLQSALATLRQADPDAPADLDVLDTVTETAHAITFDV